MNKINENVSFVTYKSYNIFRIEASENEINLVTLNISNDGSEVRRDRLMHYNSKSGDFISSYEGAIPELKESVESVINRLSWREKEDLDSKSKRGLLLDLLEKDLRFGKKAIIVYIKSYKLQFPDKIDMLNKFEARI